MLQQTFASTALHAVLQSLYKSNYYDLHKYTLDYHSLLTVKHTIISCPTDAEYQSIITTTLKQHNPF